TLFLGMTDHVEVFGTDGVQKAVWASMGDEAILTSVAVTADVVFTADAGNRLVWRFDRSGKLLGFIGTPEGGAGSQAFIVPSPYFDVAPALDGSLWIVDPGRRKVANFTLEGKRNFDWGTSSMRIDGFCG
ncbi:MAG: NHL repeat-containing protein, partial [Planctomycetota bacterium]